MGAERARMKASELLAKSAEPFDQACMMVLEMESKIDRLQAAITALADTELLELACIGSDAPVEDALGRLFALVPNADVTGLAPRKGDK